VPAHPRHDPIRLTDGAFYGADPHPHLRWMREHAPVYWDAAGQVWGITRYDDVFALERDTQTWRSSGGIRPDQPGMPYMIDMDDPAHRKRRALVSKGFTPRRVLEREGRLREVSIELLERAKARGRFDFVHDVAAWLPLIAIGEIIGVDPADHERIFEAFQRGGRQARSEGTGLGLTLSKRIVELHGGRIWVSSRPGAGSTFGFAVPVRQAPA